MIYMVNEDRIEAGSPAELIQKMHATSSAPAEDDAAWMADAARRLEIQSGAVIRLDSPEHFVADLIEAGVVKEIA